MIIQNGTLQAKSTSGGGFVHGVPQAVTETWGDPIPCNIRENRSDHRGQYVDGKFIRYAATLLIEPQEFTAKRIKVADNLGRDIGEFEVQSCRLLHAVGALEITIANT